MPAAKVFELQFDDFNESEMARHGVRPREVRQVLDSAPAFFRNKRGHAATLQVGQRDAFVWQRPPVLALGEDRFDRAYVVMLGSSEDADVLRDACDPLLVIHERRAGVWLRSDTHRVSLSWRGLESDPVVLDAARDALLTLATRHRPGMPYR